MIKFLVILIFFLLPFTAAAHSGGTNAAGCHTDTISGGYHCHTSSTVATTPTCAAGQLWSGISCYTPVVLMCGGGRIASAGVCVCPASYLWSGVACYASKVFRLPGARNDYTLSKIATGLTATRGSETWMLDNSPTLTFSDVSLGFSIAAQAQAIPASDLRLLIELYIAFFNRVPDADGLSYWIAELRNGKTIENIADSFHAAAIQYPALTGYSAATTHADFVRIIYKNVLGRSGATAPPDADVNYWRYALDTGRATKGALVRAILAAAHGFTGDQTWGWVPQLLDKKYYVGHYFAVQHGINYLSAEENIRRTMAVAAAVTPTDMTAAIRLIGVADTAFSMVDDLILSLDYGGFQLAYSCTERTARRYEYALGFDTGTEARPSSFTSDPDLPAYCGQQSTTGSYAAIETGWDRGHLVTSNHMDYSAPFMKRANYMTNVVPQNSAFNQGIWLQAENVAECYRDIASLTVYGGVVYDDPVNDRFIASHGIRTPDYFWKVIVTTDPASRVTRAIAWHIPNRANLSSLDSYLVSIRELEQRVGAVNVGIHVPEAVKLDKPPATWPLPRTCDFG
ncbi:MAG: DNA/RNA non-specific endonuclease [Herminiimonas sp.]|nr:DNA/RNA non-specific endonuclease [Herminiimonas sp.]